MNSIRDFLNSTLNYDENNNKIMNQIDYNEILSNKPNESGCYLSTVRPEIIDFILNMILIEKNLYCNECDMNMKWSPSESLGLFHWKCPSCSRRALVNGTFQNEKYGMRNILLGLLSWWNNETIEEVSEKLSIKKNVIHKLFQLSGNIVEKHIKSNISQWQIGGSNVIVLVDTYPEGCTNSTIGHRPILCIAECMVKQNSTHPTMWFEALEIDGDNQQEIDRLNNQKCLEIIQKVIRPGSIVIVRQGATLCSFEDLREIQNRFQLLISDEKLAECNTEDVNIYRNLGVIWREALDVCRKAQNCHPSLVQSFLHCYMWRQKFENEGYYHLINEIFQNSGFQLENAP